jgi:hypothetical protein
LGHPVQGESNFVIQISREGISLFLLTLNYKFIIPLGIAKTKRSYGHRLPKQLKILKFDVPILLFALGITVQLFDILLSAG